MVEMGRWPRVTGGALLVAALTGACRTTAQFAPSLPAEAGWGAVADVARILRESPQHPAGSYLFGAIGWKDAADVRREDGTSFLTLCTPDPARERGTRTAGRR